jgi:hypothetical protein
MTGRACLEIYLVCQTSAYRPFANLSLLKLLQKQRSTNRGGKTKMREGMLAIFFGCVLTLLLFAVADAASAPKELYGKSVAVQWSESVTGRGVDDQTAQNFLISRLMNVYVSSAGRPFVRLIGGGARFGRSGGDSFTAPGQSDVKDRVDFQGRSIVVYRELPSGARRISVDVDGGGTGCKAGVVNGRQAGKTITLQMGGRGRIEVTSIQISSVSCSIQNGNVFGQ